MSGIQSYRQTRKQHAVRHTADICMSAEGTRKGMGVWGAMGEQEQLNKKWSLEECTNKGDSYIEHHCAMTCLALPQKQGEP